VTDRNSFNLYFLLSTTRLTLIVILFLLQALNSAVKAAPRSGPDEMRDFVRHDGFLPLLVNPKKNLVYLELSPAAIAREFIYTTGLSSGVGSVRYGVDKSTLGNALLCRFVPYGDKILLEAVNVDFRAEDSNQELSKAVALSFPTSILAALKVVSEKDGTYVVDTDALALRDGFGLTRRLQYPMRNVNGFFVLDKSGSANDWTLVRERSAINLEHTKAFPLNTEIEVKLTFTGPAVSSIDTPEPGVLTILEHYSLFALPSQGYYPRRYDPRVGFFNDPFLDFSQPYNRPLEKSYIERWRLAKKDPTSSLSEPVIPITFYLDPAIPEPIRSAVKRGALRWDKAFEQAGFRNALRIEDLPVGADPLDLRYSTIQWTNRNGRGWSVGMTQTDPRTGEIVHAIVQLDSHRMRTTSNFWAALEVPQNNARNEFESTAFDLLDGIDNKTTEESVVENRIALLACHEMGHALGLDHNFIASTYDRGSVMDYYAPRITFRPDGSVDLSNAYMTDLGSYDRFAIEWGYSLPKNPDVTNAEEQKRLDNIVANARRQQIIYAGRSDPRWNAYDDGPDPVTCLRNAVPIRDKLLTSYGRSLLRQGDPSSNLSSRIAVIYFFHQYALQAALKVIGGAMVPPTVAGDGQVPVQVWPESEQRAALKLELEALEPRELAIPTSLWQFLPPPENYQNDPETFQSSAGYVFDRADAARAIAGLVISGLLDAERLERLQQIRTVGGAAISPSDVITALIQNTFSSASKTSDAEDQSLRNVVRDELLTRMMNLAVDDKATPEVQADAWLGIDEIDKQLAGLSPSGNNTGMTSHFRNEIRLFKNDPRNNVPKPRASMAPPGPPI
jgi:hypothetical protein